MPKANSTQYKLYWTTPGSTEYTEILPPDFENLVQVRDWINQRVAKYPDDIWHLDEIKTGPTGAETARRVLFTQDTWTG